MLLMSCSFRLSSVLSSEIIQYFIIQREIKIFQVPSASQILRSAFFGPHLFRFIFLFASLELEFSKKNATEWYFSDRNCFNFFKYKVLKLIQQLSAIEASVFFRVAFTSENMGSLNRGTYVFSVP